MLEDIRFAAYKSMVLGSDRFIVEVEALTSKRLTEGKRGRSVGRRRVKNNA
ncbi:hypothetical protein GARC_3275 [Paraglaciecola arctica BSs20135]|uniref:Uncharacterized protein n=1 Tax=Paraglaciecola arctica BSs20135 TaxID=493475 RepID=K6XHV3_9ALTE|nr:hypothetical protein GARC_3275 [Paraglaciecola arctica BSs20135]